MAREKTGVKIAPSILAADFAPLGEQVREAEQAGVDRIHIDVMDGHFVPNLSLGAPVVASLRRVTRLAFEVHLMIRNPDVFLLEFAEAGADSFIVHWEGNLNLHRTIQSIRALGKRVAVAINPATPASALEEVIPEIDQVLVMTVDPGFGHQSFLHSTLRKSGTVRQMVNRLHPTCDLEVDGGIDGCTARLSVAEGADVLVAGSAVLGHPGGVTAGIVQLRSSLQAIA